MQVSSYDNSGQVCSIDFYIDGVLKAHDPLAMGEFNADLTPYTSGSTVVFTATATDCAGNTSTSPPVHIGIE